MANHVTEVISLVKRIPGDIPGHEPEAFIYFGFLPVIWYCIGDRIIDAVTVVAGPEISDGQQYFLGEGK